MKRSILAKGKQVVEWLFFDSTDRLRRFTKSGKNAAEVIVINKGLSDGRRTGTNKQTHVSTNAPSSLLVSLVVLSIDWCGADVIIPGIPCALPFFRDMTCIGQKPDTQSYVDT